MCFFTNEKEKMFFELRDNMVPFPGLNLPQKPGVSNGFYANMTRR